MSHSETTAAVKRGTSTPEKEVEMFTFGICILSTTIGIRWKWLSIFHHSLEHSNEEMKAEECNCGVLYSSSQSMVKDNTNNHYTSEAQPPALVPVPIKNHFTADAKCQIKPLTPLYDSDHDIDEVGTMLNAPILLNIDQCEFDDPMYEGTSHLVSEKNPLLSLDPLHETKHSVLSLGEESCPELLNYEEDMNASEYSDPIVSDDISVANGHRDTIVNIYDTFDDPT